jgi:hypothetical protein
MNGTFKNIPTCGKPRDTGCLVAFSSFDVSAPPPANSLFGLSPDGGPQVVCTNPSTLAGTTNPYGGAYFPVKIFNPLLQPTIQPPDASTPFVLYKDSFNGDCVLQNGYSYLQVAFLGDGGDGRAIPPYRDLAAEGLGFGTHLVDFDIPMTELLATVKLQASAAGL